MNREFFNQRFTALLISFPNTAWVTPQTQDVFFERLKAIPDAMFDRGVEHCLDHCHFFPTIAEIGNACVLIPERTWRDRLEDRLQNAKPSLPPPTPGEAVKILSATVAQIEEKEKQQAEETEKKKIEEANRRREELRAQKRIIDFNERAEK